jgi:transcriptional regulator with XRE-family HTH domain
MDYKKEIGRRIRLARDEKGYTLADLSRKTDDVLGIKRISHYEHGLRMPGPSEAVILAKALGKRASWIMAVDDAQLPISLQEETLIRNWRTLNEAQRMNFYRELETMAMASRDPVPDHRVARSQGSLPKPKGRQSGAVTATATKRN